MKIRLFVAAALVSFSGTTVLAQTAERQWYLSPTVKLVINDSHRDKDKGYGVGLFVGKYVNENWNVEIGGQYLRLDGTRDEQSTIAVDGLYFSNRNPSFAPYVLLGAGIVRENAGNYNPVAQAGLGFTKKISDTLEFRSDARFHWHPNKEHQSTNGGLGDWVISVGFNKYYKW